MSFSTALSHLILCFFYSKNHKNNKSHGKKLVFIKAFSGLKGPVGDEKQEESDEVSDAY